MGGAHFDQYTMEAKTGAKRKETRNEVRREKGWGEKSRGGEGRTEERREPEERRRGRGEEGEWTQKLKKHSVKHNHHLKRSIASP